ncbi:unnamed protein product [Rhizophagus irregularis]|nr:unnamed protein product [Rhizophagus irregularis]CAB5362347.1 unnamed protein product [Rhizophagus irregularis]
MAEVFTLSEDDNIEDSNYIITDQDFEENSYEKLKINNKQLNDELNSLQIYNHNLEKKINKFKRKSDQFNTPKSSSTIVSTSNGIYNRKQSRFQMTFGSH